LFIPSKQILSFVGVFFDM